MAALSANARASPNKWNENNFSDNQSVSHDSILQRTSIYVAKWNISQIIVQVERFHLQIGLEGFGTLCTHLLLPQRFVPVRTA